MSHLPNDDDREGAGEITRELHAFTSREEEALDRVMELVYAQLRGIAHKALRKARDADMEITLETDDLFQEFYLKLRSLAPENLAFDHRGGFFRYCIALMQSHLRDHSAKRHALKRGGDDRTASLEDPLSPHSLRTLADIIPEQRGLSFADVLAFEDLLERHQAQFPRQADALAYKVYLGMKDEDIAQLLGISVATLNRDLREARAWLAQHWNPANQCNASTGS
jgi:RNA polymerase sigma factor (TIGR02999 family)